MANVPLSLDQRKRVGEILSSYIESGRQQLGSARDWWAECAAVHRNEVRGYAGTSEDPGYEIFHVPLSQPRQDALSAQVCAVVGRQEPIMLDTSSDEPIAQAKQRIVDRVWRDAHFEERIRVAARIAGNTDLAFYRLCPFGDEQVEISVHDPLDVVVFPALASGMADVTIIGHRVFKRKRDVEAGRREDAYYPVINDLPESSPATSEGQTGGLDRSGIVEAGSPLPELDALVELWDVVVWLGLDKLKANKEGEASAQEGWYRATVCPDASEVLALEPYPYSRPWYFRSRFIGSEEYYPTTSVARNLLPIQRAYNNLQSAFYAATMMGIASPIFGPKLADEKYTTYGTFQYIETDTTVTPWSPAVRPMTAPIPLMLQNYERLADKVARISQNMAGSDAMNQTATEAQIVASGVAVGLEEYIANFTAEFSDMASLTLEIVGKRPHGFARRFGIVEPAPPEPMEMPPPTNPLAGLMAGMSPGGMG